MGILDNISKQPGLLALGALAIGLFIFRDKISGFFSDITGGAAGAASIAETGGILARNLQSNLTQTPLPEDPLFGESGFFTNIGKAISDFKFPTFDFPSLPAAFGVAEPAQPSLGVFADFTDVGMAAARARQDTPIETITVPIGRLPGFEAAKELANLGIPSAGRVVADLPPSQPFAVTNVPETQAEFQERSAAFVEFFPEVTRATSLPGSALVFGTQLSRNQEDFESVLEAEARRSESIFTALFGNVQNPNF